MPRTPQSPAPPGAHRRTARRRSPATALTAAALGLVALVGGPAAIPAAHAAPSVADARSAAAELRAAVEHLQVAAEQASEDYDAAQEKLGAAVQRYMATEEQLDAARRRSGAQADAAAARVRALYESGGAVGLYATMLDSTSITDALTRVQLARNVIADSQAQAVAAGGQVGELADLRTRLAGLADEQTRLQSVAAAKAAHVRDLLGRREAMLAAADQRVRDLAAAEQAARAEAAARAFIAQLEAARAAAVAAGQPVGNGVAPSGIAAAAIAAARTRLGTPYVWGATGPASFDCSGLTGWAYARAGLRLPRTSREQWYAGPHVGLAELAAGDLLFWATDPANPATIHHVALYIGDGMMIAAPHTGAVVQVQPVYYTGYVGAVRPTG